MVFSSHGWLGAEGSLRDSHEQSSVSLLVWDHPYPAGFVGCNQLARCFSLCPANSSNGNGLHFHFSEPQVRLVPNRPYDTVITLDFDHRQHYNDIPAVLQLRQESQTSEMGDLDAKLTLKIKKSFGRGNTGKLSRSLGQDDCLMLLARHWRDV